MSGATVTFQFFERIKGGPLLSNIEKYNRFKEVIYFGGSEVIRMGIDLELR